MDILVRGWGQCRVRNATIVKLICAFGWHFRPLNKERLRLLDIANGYRAGAARVEACELSGLVNILSPTSANGTKRTSMLTLSMSAIGGKADIPNSLANVR